MPGDNFTPKTWLGVQQLIEHFAATTLFVVDGTDINAPTTWPDFADIRMLLNSRAGYAPNNESLSTDLNTLFQANSMPGAFSMYIGIDDFIRFENSAESIEITATTSSIFGLVQGTVYSSAFVDGVHRIIAPLKWRRGNFDASEALLFVEGTGATVWSDTGYPDREGTYESVPAALGSAFDFADVGNPTPDLEARPLDNVSQLLVAAKSAADAGKFTLSDDGRVIFAVLASYSDPSLSTDFLSWLGFDGTESFVATTAVADSTDMKEAVANNPPTGLLMLDDRPLLEAEPNVQFEGEAIILSDTRVERGHVYTAQGWNISFVLTGRASDNPTVWVAVREFFALLWKSEFFTIWQDHLEPRRAHPATGVSKQDYSFESTIEWDMRTGFLRLTPTPAYKGVTLGLANPRIRKQYLPVQIPAFTYVRA